MVIGIFFYVCAFMCVCIRVCELLVLGELGSGGRIFLYGFCDLF
jgi:hypothetical protein